MITASSITPSDWIDSRAEWPMESYMSAWRLFRRLSDESQVTAEHIISRKLWPHHLPDLRIADLGCGDGRVLEALILSSPKPVRAAHLVDINSELLEHAEYRIKGLELVDNVMTSCKSAGDAILDIANHIDAALAVHLVYLLKEHELQELFSRITAGIPLFIVMDQPSSVFTKLWERTAPKYYNRSLDAHRIISTLSKEKYAVEKTEFGTHLTNPLNLREDIRDSVLSLLCYKEIRDLDQETRSWVKNVISAHSTTERVVCDCVCYELIRLS